jgi:hypothetical protein
MLWSADYLPTRTPDNPETEYDNSNPDNTLKKWNLDYSDTELVYNKSLKPLQLEKNKHIIHGKILLTPHAVKTFSRVVERYADIYGDEAELKKLADKIKDMSIISQNLSGFSDYFSSFRQALQFPVFNIGEDIEVTKKIAQSIDRERQSIIEYTDLLPLRGGYIKITDLTLVGSFGQKQPLIQKSYYNTCEVGFAESIRCNETGYGLLKPSFTSLARLNADFVSAANNKELTTELASTSPICGILIPEMLNRRLLAYTADGDYIGMVKTVYRNKTITARWLSAPNLSPDFDKIDFKDNNFKLFLKNLYSAENAFYEFNRLMEQYLDYKQNLSTLIWGRPLILARVKLNFEFLGKPQFSKKFKDFNKNNTFGSEKIRFNFKMGDIQRVTDGLLGYFNDSDFSKLFPPFGATDSQVTEKYIQYSKQNLDISNIDGDRFMTLLMEPNSAVNIHTGILPVKKINCIPEHTEISQNLSLSAEFSPLLTQTDRAELPPLPQPEEGFEYTRYVLDNDKYNVFEITSPIVSFEQTILTDGLIVKECTKNGNEQ